MSRGTFIIIFSILMALIIVLAGWAISHAQERTWDVCYEMTNREIEWTGAGYSGK